MESPILIFAFLLCVGHALDRNCPLPENIAPLCTCKDLGDGPMMMCKNLMSPEDMIAPIKETEKHDMFSLSIHDSSLLYLPKGVFKKTYFKKVRLVATELMSLAENDLAFEGLEETLEEFRVMDAHYVTQWSWSHLRNLKMLQLIDIDWISLGSIDEPFPPLNSLSFLGLTRADIAFVIEDAFGDLENLRVLTLKNNDISDLSRSMFPNPASHLAILDLSGNKLNSLPRDIFHDMPNLDEVNLGDNEFVTLSEAPFSSVMGNGIRLSLAGNNLRCDCRLEWIVSARIPLEFAAKCSEPERLKGVNLRHLQLRDLMC